VSVEKLPAPKFAKIKLRQDALGSIFSGRLDIFYPPNLGCLGRKESFSTDTVDAISDFTDDFACLGVPIGPRIQRAADPGDQKPSKNEVGAPQELTRAVFGNPGSAPSN